MTPTQKIKCTALQIATQKVFSFGILCKFITCSTYPHTQHNFQLHAKHLGLQTVQFFSCCSYVIYTIFSVIRHLTNINLTFHNTPPEKFKMASQIWRSRSPGSKLLWLHNHSGNCLFKNVFTSEWTCGGILLYTDNSNMMFWQKEGTRTYV